MIKLGIIGMSEGNAHPYSWSAIINGQFDANEITAVGYPAVAAYLQANWDTLGLPDARVTHVWCQEKNISQSIARSSGIEYVVEHFEEMVGQVDAVILGRDDPENHVAMAKPFVEAGVPIFIDKPMVFSQEDLCWFSEKIKQGAFIMSCSSMRYANECRILKQELGSLGPIELVSAVGKKDWKKYGIHLLEAIFTVLDAPNPVSVQHIGELDREIVHVKLANGTDITLHLFNAISGTFQLTFFGQNGWKTVDIRNSYSMFRDNMMAFIRSVQEGQCRLDFSETYTLMKVIIAGKESLYSGGQRIFLG